MFGFYLNRSHIVLLCVYVLPGPPESWPPQSTIVPLEPELTLPAGANCGEIIQDTQGRFEAPNYPNYTHNLECAWAVEVPLGYHIRLQFPASGVRSRYDSITLLCMLGKYFLFVVSCTHNTN